MSPVTWTSVGTKLTDDSLLSQLSTILDDESSIVVEHCHFFGASAPTRLVFEHHEHLVEYIGNKVRPGDKFHIWVFERCCRTDNMLTFALMPNEHGLIPEGGSY